MVKNREELPDVDVQVIDQFVQLARLVGLPKSLGEIYGLLYMSEEPMSMDQIIEKLNISLGSASQGLKQLKSFKAVKSAYVPGQRKDHYIAELELRKLVAGFVQGDVLPYLDNSADRIEQLQEAAAGSLSGDMEFKQERLENMKRWHRKGQSFLKNGLKLISW